MDKFVKRHSKKGSPGSSTDESTRSRSRSPTKTIKGKNEPNLKENSSANSISYSRKKISAVWKYFKRSGDRKYAKCMTCGKEYKTSGNTSNLTDHLRRFHPILENGQDEGDTLLTTSSGSSSRCSARSISPFFKRTIHYDQSSQRKKDLDNALLEMITLDFQPFTIVNDRGFRNFINILDPKYELPTTYALREKLLKDAYLEAYKVLKIELNAVDYVAITCDSWTSVSTESYLTVTCHYINNDLELKSAVLSTKPLSDGINHTSENIANSLVDIFGEWDINSKVTCIVTDNAANMIKACDIMQKRHLPCYAHTLNLVVQDGLRLDCIKEIIKKVKDIVGFFKSSVVAMETFKKEQNTEVPLKLLQEVPTRWNSVFYMVQRVIKTNEAVGRTLLKLRKAPLPLSVDDLNILMDIEKVLSCFEEATNKISGNNYVTISLIIPVTFGIYNFLTNCLLELTSEEGKLLCNTLLDTVKKRLFPYEGRSVCKLATIMDPRFKKEGFRSPDNANSAGKLLEQDMFALIKKNNEHSKNKQDTITSSDSLNDESNSSSSSLFGFLQQRVEEKSKSVTADVIVTKRQYLEKPNSSENSDPLLFWKVTGLTLTPLDECCRKYFCIPATSVASERIFSATGQLISDRRSRLKPKNVNMLIFLNKNFNICADAGRK